MKLLLITNPAAGKNNGLKISETATTFFKNNRIEPVVVTSQYSGHILKIIQETDLSPYQGIVAIGGDGTLFEIINGLLKKYDDVPMPIGQVPVGTGNSFIKDLDINDPKTALQKIVAGKTRKIDVGFFKSPQYDFYFINLLGLGFVSKVAFTANKYKTFGDFSYIIAVIEEVVKLKSCSLEITIDGKTYQRDNVFVEICNSTRTGGDMIMAPEAKIDDGLLDIILVNKISRLKLLKTFPKIFKGTHITIPETEYFKGKQIKVTTDVPQKLTPDGEVIGTTPIDVKILPQKISMFC